MPRSRPDRAGGVEAPRLFGDAAARQWGRSGEVGGRRKGDVGFGRLTVAQYERALVFRERSLARVLAWRVLAVEPAARISVQLYDVTPDSRARVDVLLAEARELLEPLCDSWNLPREWAWSTKRTSVGRASAGHASSTGVVR
jgi:hypothetical protein